MTFITRTFSCNYNEVRKHVSHVIARVKNIPPSQNTPITPRTSVGSFVPNQIHGFTKACFHRLSLDWLSPLSPEL